MADERRVYLRRLAVLALGTLGLRVSNAGRLRKSRSVPKMTTFARLRYTLVRRSMHRRCGFSRGKT